MPVLDKILQKLVLNRILAVPDCKIHRLQGGIPNGTECINNCIYDRRNYQRLL